MKDSEWEELARALNDNPGAWLEWPEAFLSESAAKERMESVRGGGLEPFKVDSAAFRWRIDEFRRIVEPGMVRVEVSCAW